MSANDNQSTIFKQLMNQIEERKTIPVEKSYTNYLFEKGTDKIAKKLIEEAGEVVIAAKNNDQQEIVNEVSDLLYHCFVLMADQGVTLEAVEAEMSNRHSKKGNVKAERKEIENW